MCGRFTYHIPWEDLARMLRGICGSLREDAGPEVTGQPARYNIAPTQPVLAVRRQGGEYVPQLMRWGLVPGWVKDPREFSVLINARAETMAEKPSFRNSVKNQRCVVPASGYYEWRCNPDGTKTPFYIARADAKPLLLAGLFSTWMGPSGEEIDSAAIVTVAAKGGMKTIHDRTPAILGDRQAAEWLDTANVNARGALELIGPAPDTEMVFHPVSRRVNSPSVDDEGLIVPVYEEKPEKPQPDRKTGGQLDLF